MSVLRHPVFSPTVMEHFTSPRREGALEKPDAQGWSGPAEAPHQVGIDLSIKCGHIARFGFTLQVRTPLRVAAASVLGDWAMSQAVATAASLTMDILARRMGRIPNSMHHDVALVLEAFLNAVAVLDHAPTATS